MTTTISFSTLLRLLDDDTPAVRAMVAEKLQEYGGDVSEMLIECPQALSDEEKEILSDLLKPARRENLLLDWEVPQRGWRVMHDDWEHLESCLRQISDYLHDGVSLRPPLPDQLDMLADEARPVIEHAGIDGLRIYLFQSGRLQGNHSHYLDPRNSDLAWCIENGVSNPIGLALIFILVAQRLGLEVDGVNNPGHFLCRVHHGGQPFLVDCFHLGELHSIHQIMASNNVADDHIALLIEGVATPGEILLRVLRNLQHALKKQGEEEDAALIHMLFESLKP
ncbi:MAG: hypothetical protein RLZZ224_949 [Verrucomicrobiota bacterium]|jgi:hypothetical protein